MPHFPHSDTTRSWVYDTLFLSAIIAFFYLIFLGDRPLFVPDEGRYAEIIREMVVSHDYITPRLNGVLYFEKPILFYWLGAIAVHLGSLSVETLRSLNAILGVIGCLMTYAFARICYGRSTGLLAGFIQASCLLYFVMSHLITLDLSLSVFLSGCLYACFLGFKRKSSAYFYLAAIFSGLAILTKGLVGLVFPGIILLAWIALTSQWAGLKRIPWIGASLLLLVIILPWHIAVQLKNPAFFDFYFINQQILRYTEKGVGHYQPATFFIPYLLLGLFPWVIFLGQAFASAYQWIKERKHYQTELYLSLWAILIFLFFSFSQSKLIPYILPVIPPLTILIAKRLMMCIRSQRKIELILSLLALSLIALITTFVVINQSHSLPSNQPHTAHFDLLIATSVLLGTSLGSLFICFWNIRYALYFLSFASLLLSTSFMQSFGSYDTRTIAPLATYLKPHLSPQDEVISYYKYYQDLPFYLEKRITIVNWQNELSFGMAHQDTHEWIIGDDVFWKRWQSKKHLYVILSKKDFRALQAKHPSTAFLILRSTVSDVLISNHPTELPS